MNYRICAGDLSAEISSSGAELVSVKDNGGNEYIWTAEDVWKRHAPLLFPFVCNTASKKYTVDGREYALSNHGFARDSEFTVTDKGEDFVTMTLSSSDKTKEKYPFDFLLTVTYRVSGNRLSQEMKVKNTGSGEMYFFMGGHPGFLCPFTADRDSTFEDYDVVYEKPEMVIQQLPGGDVTVLDNGTTVPVTRELFKNDVFLKDMPASSKISLVSRKSGRSVTVSYDRSGCIAVWSPYDDRAGFVCLEPWAAAPVYCCDTEELTEMPHAKRLAAGGEFSFGFDISVNG